MAGGGTEVLRNFFDFRLTGIDFPVVDSPRLHREVARGYDWLCPALACASAAGGAVWRARSILSVPSQHPRAVAASCPAQRLLDPERPAAPGQTGS